MTRTYLKEQNAEALARVSLVETFFPIIDTLSIHIQQRLGSYRNNSKRFYLFCHLKTEF